MRLVLLLGVLGLGCVPQLDGATCLRHDNCPDAQYCGADCVCLVGDRAAQPAACAGYREKERFELDELSSTTILQCSANGSVVAVWTPLNSRGNPQTRQYQRSSTGWTAVGTFELAASVTSSPMGLSPAGDALAVRLISGVTQYTVGSLSTQSVDVWYEPAIAVAHAGSEIVASFASLGVRAKRVGQSTSLPGTLIDADAAEELQVSRSGAVIAGRFGQTARLYRDGVAAGSWAAQRIDLSSDGTTLALVRANEVQVVSTVAASNATLSIRGAREAVLDGAGRTLVIGLLTGTEVYTASTSGWTRVGALTLTASGLALTDDGETLFVGLPAEKRVAVFTRFR